MNGCLQLGNGNIASILLFWSGFVGLMSVRAWLLGFEALADLLPRRLATAAWGGQ